MTHTTASTTTQFSGASAPQHGEAKLFKKEVSRLKRQNKELRRLVNAPGDSATTSHALEHIDAASSGTPTQLLERIAELQAENQRLRERDSSAGGSLGASKPTSASSSSSSSSSAKLRKERKQWKLEKNSLEMRVRELQSTNKKLARARGSGSALSLAGSTGSGGDPETGSNTASALNSRWAELQAERQTLEEERAQVDDEKRKTIERKDEIDRELALVQSEREVRVERERERERERECVCVCVGGWVGVCLCLV
jgi:hypothetical protein